MLAEATAQVIAQGRDDPVNYLTQKSGLYHLSGGGFCSRYEWAKKILELNSNVSNLKIKEIVPAKSNEYSNAAARPLNSALAVEKITDQLNVFVDRWDSILTVAFNY
jgi:dTDP-4-dehydrorhamnose reductase